MSAGIVHGALFALPSSRSMSRPPASLTPPSRVCGSRSGRIPRESPDAPEDLSKETPALGTPARAHSSGPRALAPAQTEASVNPAPHRGEKDTLGTSEHARTGRVGTCAAAVPASPWTRARLHQCRQRGVRWRQLPIPRSFPAASRSHGPVRLWDPTERRLRLGGRDLWLAADVQTGDLALDTQIIVKGYQEEPSERWIVDLVTVAASGPRRRPIMRESRARL